MRVIVVDDFPVIRRMVANILTNLGFTDITQAKNGKEAWDRISASHDLPEKRFEIAFVDWNMPIISGVQLLRKLRANSGYSDLVFIMITAEGTQENILTAIQGGVDDYIIKPFQSSTIQEKLLSIAAKKHREIEKEADNFLESKSLELESAEFDKYHKALHKKILKINQYIPWSSMAPFASGRLHYKFKKMEKAEIALRKTIALDFGLTEAHKLLSQTLKTLGKLAESVEELEVAVTERPNSPHLRQKLGDAYLREGKYELAIHELSEAVRLSEKKDTGLLSKTQNSLGNAKVGMAEETDDNNLKEEGVDNIKNAVDLNPDFISARYDLMIAYKKTGRPEAALSVLDSLKKIEPKDAEGWVALGKTFLEQSEPQKAMFAFKKADGMAQGVFEIYKQICTQLSAHQLFDEALPLLDKASECNPGVPWSYNMKGIIYRKKGNFPKAIEEYTKASQIDPDDAAVFFNLGVAHYKNNQRKRCPEFFKKALALDPGLEGQIKPFQ